MRIAEESKAVKQRQVGEGGEQAELGPPLSIRAAGEACPNEGTVGRELTDVREWSMLFI